MKKLPKNSRAEKICLAWSADFKQRNQLEDAGFWHSIALGFSNGAEINDDAFETLTSEVLSRAKIGNDLAEILAKQNDNPTSKQLKDTLLELSREAGFVKSILG